MAAPVIAGYTFGQAILFTLISVRLASPIEMIQLREETHISVDSSCPSVHIDACLQSSNDSCTSLEEALIKYYNTESGQRLTADTPYYIFSVFDLFYSGIVSGENSPPATSKDLELESARVVNSGIRGCEALLRKLKLSKKDTDDCHWDYVCKYNPHYFPSFTIEAHLNEALSDWYVCEALRTRSLKFVRTDCLSDADKSNWCPCNAGYITTGYEHNPSY